MKVKSDFVLDWEQALGFKGDPFADKIFSPASKFLVNRADEKEKLNWFFIKGYFYGSIIGEHGVGKTSILKWLEERLNRYNRIHVVYINAAVFKEQINIPQQLLAPLLSLYEKFLTKPHQRVLNFDPIAVLKKKLGSKSVAILLDNAHNITDRNLELLRNLREEGLKIQIIAASTQADYEKSRLSEFGTDDLNIRLRRLTLDESKEMIKKRVEAQGGRGHAPFSEDILQALYEKAEKNSRQFLHYCRDEAIRILIHKRDMIDQDYAQPVVMRQQAPPAPKQTIRESAQNLMQPKEKPRQSAPGKTLIESGEKKKLFSIKFKFDQKPGMSDELEMPTKFEKTSQKEQIPLFRDDDRKAVFNDNYKQELINKLSGPSRKKPVSKRQPISDEDKTIKDLADEFYSI